jgi:DNA-binding PadR family transcriptional regulator
MSRARTTGLSAGEAVLGLVIERPDRGFGLERRLEERFGAARFAYSTAYNALYRMQRQGLVRVADAEPVSGEPLNGEQRSAREATYEATSAGVVYFRDWLRAPTSAPVLREELHAKIALCEPRDLPRLIDAVHEEELACVRELDAIRERMLTEQRGTSGQPLAEQEWSKLMGRGVAGGEAAFWGGRITQLAQLRHYLEELRGEAERRALQEHRRELVRDRRAG